MNIGHTKPPKKVKKSNAIPIEVVTAVFERDKNICQYCGILTAGTEEDSQLVSAHPHHIIKRRKIDGHQVEFINCCCWECHGKHGGITKVDTRWLDGKNVYYSGRLNN